MRYIDGLHKQRWARQNVHRLSEAWRMVALLLLLIAAAAIAIGVSSAHITTAFARTGTLSTEDRTPTPTVQIKDDKSKVATPTLTLTPGKGNKDWTVTSTPDDKGKEDATVTPTPADKGKEDATVTPTPDKSDKKPTVVLTPNKGDKATSTPNKEATPGKSDPTPDPALRKEVKGDTLPSPTSTKTQTPIVNMTPIPEQRMTGWERIALSDLAEVNSWPTAVTYDSAGRLKVQNNGSEALWSMRAQIRAFDYAAGASAAFNAEQEDAQYSGFQVSTQTFYSYSAYQGQLSSGTNTNVVREARFRWLARTWIFGIDVRSVGGQPVPSTEMMRLLSEQLLSLATTRGLPPPPTEIPTPNPTWHLQPNATPTVQTCGTTFWDVAPSYWAYRFIIELACSGNITGYDDGSFRPDNPTTRAQFAKILVLTQGWTLVNHRSQTFQDVGRDHPFYDYIETAAAHGVVTGYDNNLYVPDAFVTRAQLAKMLVLARGWRTFEQNPVSLCDVTSEYWAWYYVQAAYQNGLFSGYEDYCFHPDARATRAQLAKLLIFASR